VGVSLFAGARPLGRAEVRAHIADIARGLRGRHFLLCWPTLAAVAVAAVALLQVPGLSWGWWSSLGGVGSPIFAVNDKTGTNPASLIVPVLFAAMLIPALPLFAESEERKYRLGAEHLSTWGRAKRGVQFGLVHCIIGVPIAVGLALSIGGWYFTWCYLRGYRRSGGSPVAAMTESTRAHLAYNITILAVIAVSLAFGV
jgi:hypothetical protein